MISATMPSMIKFLALIIFTFSFLNANTHKKMEASYDVSYGIFGRLGIATASIEIQNNKYMIKMMASATGMAKFLSNGKKEIYTSSGLVQGNTFIPQTYTKISKNNKKDIRKIYTFDHINNKISVQRTSNRLTNTVKKGLLGEKEEKKWIKKSSVKDLKYFASNDLLSLFFNIKHIIPNLDKGNTYKLKAVGANKNNGLINIIIPSGNEYKSLEKDLNIKSSEKFIVQINQKIFSSKKGELFISLNKFGICNKAVLKDVVMFGDIVGIMTAFKMKEL